MSTKLKVEVLTNVSGIKWNDQLANSINASTYQTSNWSELYQTSFESEPIFIIVSTVDGKVVGQLSALIHKKYYWRDSNFSRLSTKLNLGTHIQWFSGPIIHDKNYENEILLEILNTLEKIASKNKMSMIRGSSSPSVKFPEKIFSKFGYTTQTWSTYVIDLNQSIEKLYNSLDKKTRYDIRKAENSNFEFEVVDKKSSWFDYINMKFEAKKKNKQHIKKKPLFYDNHWKILYHTGNEKLFLAKQNGKTVAGILCFTFNGNIIQFGIATSGSSSLAGSYVTWNTIKWAITNNFPTYDMGGVNTNPITQKEKKIDFFKSKWGGEKIDFSIYTKILDRKNYLLSKVLKNPSLIMHKLKDIFGD